MNNKQIRELMTELSPKPGYVLNLTRKQFEELVEDATDIDISESLDSNGKRLKHLLRSCTEGQIEAIIGALRAI